eukprot:g5751.t1
MCSSLSAWLADPDVPEREWPRWAYLPTRVVQLVPGKDLPEGLKPSDRNARLGLDLLWAYIEKLPLKTLLTLILSGDAAETAALASLFALLETKIRKYRPDIIYMPHYHRCSVHQITLTGEDTGKMYTQMSGTTQKRFQNKIYLQAQQYSRIA